MNNVKTDKKNTPEYSTVLLSILFLFFIQQLTILIESIYHQSLLSKQINFSIMGLLAFCSPLLLLLNSKKIPLLFNKIIIFFIVLQAITPYVNGLWKVFLSSLSILFFYIILINTLTGQFFKESHTSLSISIAILISVLLRTIGSTISIDVYGNLLISNWVLVISSLYLLWLINGYNLQLIDEEIPAEKYSGIDKYLLIIGLFSTIALFYFFLASPGILSRWTGADYNAVILLVAASVTLYIFLKTKTELIDKLDKRYIILWNTIFCMLLIISIQLNTIGTIQSPLSEPIIVDEGNTIKDFVVYVMLFLSPVLILDFVMFKRCLTGNSIAHLAVPSFIASIIFMLLILIMIFTNIWGYVGVIGKIFRNAFFLPILIASVGLLLPFLRIKILLNSPEHLKSGNKLLVFTGLLLFCGVIFTLYFKLFNENSKVLGNGFITIMTYNIQQGVDYYGYKAYEEQLEVIKKINPDILCLQESDIARVSGGNNDIVKFFQDELNFYCYYGPKTVTGTFGTAILSRYPVQDCQSIFTYSDKDEIGTSVCRVVVNSDSILIINSHPDGTDLAFQAHANMLINLISKSRNVIAAGDYNFTSKTDFYKQISSNLNDVWYQIYPDGIGEYYVQQKNTRLRNKNIRSGKLLPENKIDMAEKIDHIFVSRDLEVLQAFYLRAPESASDHPAHWAVIKMKN